MAYQNGKTFFACGQPVVVRLVDGETHIFSTDGEKLSTEDFVRLSDALYAALTEANEA
jgi:hypothetical protein